MEGDSMNFDYFLTDECTRSFLSNYVNSELFIHGYCSKIDKKGRMEVQECTYYDENLNTAIIIGHLWWQTNTSIANMQFPFYVEARGIIGTYIKSKTNKVSYNFTPNGNIEKRNLRQFETLLFMMDCQAKCATSCRNI